MAAPRFSLDDPEWLAHRLVETDDTFRFIHVPRADHATIPFLADEDLGPRETAPDVPVDQVLARPGEVPLHFLFHSAFCSSTMLVRAFDRPGLAMGVSEPRVLNDLVGFRRRGAQPRAVARAADAATRLLGRPFGPGEAVLVKPSNLLNPLALLLMMLRPQARAVFLYAPLETFLVSVARKGLHCRLWVRELLEGYMRDGVLDLAFTAEDYFRQTDLQIAAIGWLAQHKLFLGLAERLGQDRMRFLDSACLHDDPAATLAAVAGHYGLPVSNTEIAAIVAGPVFSRHSKSLAPYTSADRARDYAAIRTAHEDEIGKVVVWTQSVAASAGIPLEPAFPLVPTGPVICSDQ